MKLGTNIYTNKTKQYVLLILIAVMIIITAASIWMYTRAVEAERHVRYVGMVNVASEKIAKTIRGMEMNAMNVFDEVGKHLDSPDAVILALESKVNLNPDVRGYFAAFEPNYFPQKGRWYEPYVHQNDSGGFKVSLVGSARHDYTKSGWYIRAKQSSQSFWSDPYYYQDNDDIGISGNYCTFVKPIFNARGNLACVCGADMTMEWLVDELQQIDEDFRNDKMLNKFRLPFASSQSPSFFTVILNNDGTCLAHPEGKRVTVTDQHAISDMAQKKSGVLKMDVIGVPSTVYYAPIEYIDWLVAVVVRD